MRTDRFLSSCQHLNDDAHSLVICISAGGRHRGRGCRVHFFASVRAWSTCGCYRMEPWNASGSAPSGHQVQLWAWAAFLCWGEAKSNWWIIMWLCVCNVRCGNRMMYGRSTDLNARHHKVLHLQTGSFSSLEAQTQYMIIDLFYRTNSDILLNVR